MVVKIIKKDDEYYKIDDIIEELKRNTKVDYAGAIFTFEGIVRGKEENLKVDKLKLTTPDIEKSENEIKDIVSNVKTKYGVFEVSVIHYIGEFYTGDSLFLVGVLGPHRHETLDALKDVIERVKYDIDFKKEELSDNGTKIIMAGG